VPFISEAFSSPHHARHLEHNQNKHSHAEKIRIVDSADHAAFVLPIVTKNFEDSEDLQRDLLRSFKAHKLIVPLLFEALELFWPPKGPAAMHLSQIQFHDMRDTTRRFKDAFDLIAQLKFEHS